MEAIITLEYKGNSDSLIAFLPKDLPPIRKVIDDIISQVITRRIGVVAESVRLPWTLFTRIKEELQVNVVAGGMVRDGRLPTFAENIFVYHSPYGPVNVTPTLSGGQIIFGRRGSIHPIVCNLTAPFADAGRE